MNAAGLCCLWSPSRGGQDQEAAPVAKVQLQDGEAECAGCDGDDNSRSLSSSGDGSEEVDGGGFD